MNLGATPLGYAITNGAEAPIQITFSGQNASVNSPGDNWVAAAAAASADGYQLYWNNGVSSQFARWNISASGALVSGSFLSVPEVYVAESSIIRDLDGDSITGIPFRPGAVTLSGFNLGLTPFGYALKSADRDPISIIFSGGYASPRNPGANWVALAASPTAAGFDLYWQNPITSQFARWALGPSGSLSSASFLTPDQLNAAESTIGFDLNANGRIGAAFL